MFFWCLFNGKVVFENLALRALSQSSVHPFLREKLCETNIVFLQPSSEIDQNSLANLVICFFDLYFLFVTFSNGGYLILKQNCSCEWDECEIPAQLVLWGFKCQTFTSDPSALMTLSEQK